MTIITGVGRSKVRGDRSTAELSLERVRAPIVDVIEGKITAHPRSAQTRIGPSELGMECPRRLALKLSGAPEKPRTPAWRPTVGTAVHTWLDEAFRDLREAGETRWHPERRVSVGEVDGAEITGSCDLFDELTGTVFDWKIVGVTTLKRVKAHGPSDTYRTQAHLYGRGYQRAGYDVRRVCIAYLPAAGELDDAVWWSEDYDEDVAVAALNRASAFVRGMARLTPAVMIPQLERVESYCKSCPYFDPKGQDATRTCPGADEVQAQAAKAFTQRDILGAA